VGQGRGGWYSYDAVMNLFSSRRTTSAARIIPAFQDIQVGQVIDVTDHIYLTVHEVIPNRALVLTADERNQLSQPWSTVWALILDDDGAGGTRLIFRETTSWSVGIVTPLIRLGDPGKSFLVPQLLKNVKRLAESTPAAA
jgi:hypothetical protein